MHFYPGKFRAHNPLRYLVMASAINWMALALSPLPAMAQDTGERFSVQRVAVIDLQDNPRSEATERMVRYWTSRAKSLKEFAEKEVQLLARQRKDVKARQSLISEEAIKKKFVPFSAKWLLFNRIFKTKDNLLDRALQQAGTKSGRVYHCCRTGICAEYRSGV